ncbi:MAG: YidC/Oxa1 family membrane protein insertase [Clostridiales bacterium]|nr:YidC/Oxa1 family membrane protein insertase [Clostridiales bacterium]
MEFIYDILGIPFGFVLRFIYDLVGNYVFALVLFTLVCRVFMLPSSISQQKGAAKTQRLQSKIRKIRERYAGDQKKIQEETQALYSREGYNPMNAGCMPLLIQMPIIFGLVAVIYKPLTYALQMPEEVVTVLTQGLKELDVTYTSRTAELVVIEHFKNLGGLVAEKYAAQIRDFNFTFLGLPLGQTPSYNTPSVLWAVPILSGLSSLASSVYMNITQKRNNPEMNKNPAGGCMMVFMPLLSLVFTFQFPIGIGIYWIASNIFAFIQQVILSYTHNPRKMVARLMVEETVQRRSKENNRKLVIQKQRDS